LDWTEGALIALYFAVRHNAGDEDAAVWMLNPYKLNKPLIGKDWVTPPKRDRCGEGYVFEESSEVVTN
jgi:hypothetical protein